MTYFREQCVCSLAYNKPTNTALCSTTHPLLISLPTSPSPSQAPPQTKATTQPSNSKLPWTLYLHNARINQYYNVLLHVLLFMMNEWKMNKKNWVFFDCRTGKLLLHWVHFLFAFSPVPSPQCAVVTSTHDASIHSGSLYSPFFYLINLYYYFIYLL